MKHKSNAKKFAKTFLNIAGPAKAESAIKELSVLNDLLAKNRDFRGFLLGPQFTPAEKEKSFKKFGKIMKLSEATIKFIIYLLQKSAVSLLAEITAFAEAVHLEKKKRASAVVFTPDTITKQTELRLQSALKKLTGKDTHISIKFDPSLLGGILVKVGSTIYDSSIKGQLRLLKAELIKE